jgi:hypothetical protein
MARLMAFFEGGLSYSDLSDMPMDEFVGFIQEANKLASERKAEMGKAKHGK